MKHLYHICYKEKVNSVLSYIDENKAPLNFYIREGFEIIGTVKDFLINNEEYIPDFDNLEDYIIKKDLITETRQYAFPIQYELLEEIIELENDIINQYKKNNIDNEDNSLRNFLSK